MSTSDPSILRFFAWTATPPDAPEYVIGVAVPGLGGVPTVYHNGNSQVVVDAMRAAAEAHAKRTGNPAHLKEFTLSQVCETISPETPG